MSIICDNIVNELYNHLTTLYNKDVTKTQIDERIYLLLHDYFESYCEKSIYLSKLTIENDIKYYQQEFYLIIVKNYNIRISYSYYKKNIITIWNKVSNVYNKQKTKKRIWKWFI